MISLVKKHFQYFASQVEKKSKCTPSNLLSRFVAQNKDFGSALQMLLLGFDNICDSG